MKDEHFHGLAVYNPGLLSSEELKRYFVARKPLLERLLSDLAREQLGHAPQHRLLLGLRGMGKTTLLHRLAIAIEEDATLSQQWLPLTFPEEQYNIANLADLWLNCLDALGDKLERSGQNEIAEQLDQRISSLSRQNATAALAALMELAAQQGKRLLLLIDNIDLIFNRLKKQHWVLRETLQSESHLLVIGASAAAIEASYQYDAAFYDFFKIDELKGLTEIEMLETLLQLAEIKQNASLAQLIKTDSARIKTLHTLTGGNPRTTVLLYNVLTQGILNGDVRSDLDGLLDQVTPLYKARFEELPDQAQQMVDALAIHWDPMNANQLAENLGWEVNKVSAQLNRLQQMALVEKQPPAQGKRHLFQLGERFFNIWYLMRASRRVRRKLIWLVQFLRMFFSVDELQQHAQQRLNNVPKHQRDAEFGLALAQAIDPSPLRHALEHQALGHLLNDNKTRKAIYELLDLNGEYVVLLPIVTHMQALAEIRGKVTDALENKQLAFDKDQFCFLLLGSPLLSLEEKRQVADEVVNLSKQKLQQLFSVWQKDLNLFQKYFGNASQVFWRALANGEIKAADDLKGAQAAAEHLNQPELLAIVYACSASYITPAPKLAELIKNAYELLMKQHESTVIYYYLGYLLQDHLQHYEEAETAYRKAIELNVSFAYPWNGLGNLLQYHLQRYEEAEIAFRKAISIQPNDANTYSTLAWMLYQQKKKLPEAVELAKRAVALDNSDLYALHTLISLLIINQRWREAIPLFKRLISEASIELSEERWPDIILLFQEIITINQAESALNCLDETSAGERWRPLREALVVIVSGNDRHLNSVATEIRDPAQKIVEQLRGTKEL